MLKTFGERSNRLRHGRGRLFHKSFFYKLSQMVKFQ